MIFAKKNDVAHTRGHSTQFVQVSVTSATDAVAAANAAANAVQGAVVSSADADAYDSRLLWAHIERARNPNSPINETPENAFQSHSTRLMKQGEEMMELFTGAIKYFNDKDFINQETKTNIEEQIFHKGAEMVKKFQTSITAAEQLKLSNTEKGEIEKIESFISIFKDKINTFTAIENQLSDTINKKRDNQLETEKKSTESKELEENDEMTKNIIKNVEDKILKVIEDLKIYNEELNKELLESFLTDHMKTIKLQNNEHYIRVTKVFHELKKKFFSGKELLDEMYNVENGGYGIISNIDWNNIKSINIINDKFIDILYNRTNGIITNINDEMENLLVELRFKKIQQEIQQENIETYFESLIMEIIKGVEKNNPDDIIKKFAKIKEEYNRVITTYMKEYSLVYAFKKMINVFIFYIIQFNKFKNSFIIKKLENIRNSSKYKNTDTRTKINEEFTTLIGNSTIDDFLNNHNKLDSKYLKEIIIFLKMIISNYEKNLVDTDLKKHPKLINGIKEIIEKIQKIINKDEYKNIDYLNDIIFNYISTRFKEIKEAFFHNNERDDYKVLNLYTFDIQLIGIFYFIIIYLTQFFTKEYEQMIDVTVRSQSQKFHSLINQYSESSVISYIKIRDGKNEERQELQLFNPRYIYFSDKQPGNDEDKSLGLEKESYPPTLSLLYCNNPEKEIILPNRTDINTPEALKIFLEKNTIEYDHLFHYGHFNKIVYNIDNEKFGSNMEEIKEKLKAEKDVFVIGYGASGAGKTTTLIYDKTALQEGNENKSNGAIVFALNQLAEEYKKKDSEDGKDGKDGKNFNSLKLTITELFMEDFSEDSIKKDIPKKLVKLEEAEFKYIDNNFKITLNYNNYIKEYHLNNGENINLLLEYDDFKSNTDDEDEENNDINREFTLSEILQLLIDKKRKVSATTNNTQSSRSHILVTIKFNINLQRVAHKRPVCLYIGDFAGVENKFDYTFKYSQELKNNINKIFSENENLSRVHGPEKADLINKILNADDPYTLLSDTKNINSLLEIVFKNNLINETIWNFSNLKHAQEKWVEEFNKIYNKPNNKPSIKVLTEEYEKTFIKDGNHYFYKSHQKKEDDYYSNLINKMKSMVTFLVSSSGYNEGNLYSEDYIINDFKVTKEPTSVMEKLLNEKKEAEEELKKQELEIKTKRINIGIVDNVIDNYINKKTYTINNELLQIKKIVEEKNTNINIEIPILIGTDIDMKKIYKTFDKKVRLIQIMRSYFKQVNIKPNVVGRAPYEIKFSDNFILKVLKIILKNITLKINIESMEPEKNDVGGIKFEIDNINFENIEDKHNIMDDIITATKSIRESGTIDYKNLFKNIFNNYKKINEMFNTLNGPEKELEYPNIIANIKNILNITNIKKHISNYKDSIIDEKDNNAIIEQYKALTEKKREQEAKLKDDTQYNQSKIEEYKNTIKDIEKRMEIQNKNSDKNTIITEALVKRIIEVHYEVIKRAYEGLFINESLKEMREMMTNVLQKETEHSIVPNFNSKCTNYYTNPLLESLFEKKITTVDQTKNKFNIIHEVLYENKMRHPAVNKDSIINKLATNIVYCICLLINNTYKDTNGSINQNPPKIPYIDLTEGFAELTRFKKKK